MLKVNWLTIKWIFMQYNTLGFFFLKNNNKIIKLYTLQILIIYCFVISLSVMLYVVKSPTLWYKNIKKIKEGNNYKDMYLVFSSPFIWHNVIMFVWGTFCRHPGTSCQSAWSSHVLHLKNYIVPVYVTVQPVNKDHPQERQHMVFVDK